MGCDRATAIVNVIVCFGLDVAVRCDVHEGPVRAVVSTGGRNTLIFRKRWSVEHEVSSQNLLFVKAARGDLVSLVT
jgi:hypothetical protein